MWAAGFSWPSTTPCCMAVKSSPKAMGVGLAPEDLHHFDVNGLLHDPDLEPFYVLGLPDGIPVVRHVADAVFRTWREP